ncbi:MAG TPA: asparagine synthase-related protein [Polyangia bacterium]|nr:asparagine synthase-related protein [Polyangia bacterium]
MKRDEAAAPSWDPQSRILFAGDVRLYNRRELIAALQVRQPEGRADLELARLAYMRWGEQSPKHLVGDFAFAAWHEESRRLFAARDHLGAKSLFYRRLRDGIVVASDVRQILALVDRPFDEVDADALFDWFSRIRDQRRTFFRGIDSLLPGHLLTADSRESRQVRYWMPPTEVHRASYEENCEEIRTLFENAVRGRLESDHPIVAHSSGGFDSSTMLMAADRIYRREPGRPPLIMASATAPGYPSDESRYMDAVAAAVSFEGRRWNVVEELEPVFPGVTGSRPLLRRGLAGGPRRDYEIVRERGARVLLTGYIGDDVWYARGVLRDLARHGRWWRVVSNIIQRGVDPSTPGRLFDAALGVFPPGLAQRLAERVFSGLPPPPGWMGPALLEIQRSIGHPAARQIPGVEWQSHVVHGVWAQLTDPVVAMVLESANEEGLEEGIEVRTPFTDVRLIEHMLMIPWQQRDPRGHHRRTGRDALGALLPPEFATRIGQQSWADVWAVTSRRTAKTLAPFIVEGPWLSAPFVDRGVARAMLARVLTQTMEVPPEMSPLVVDFAALEAWLRQLLR